MSNIYLGLCMNRHAFPVFSNWDLVVWNQDERLKISDGVFH